MTAPTTADVCHDPDVPAVVADLFLVPGEVRERQAFVVGKRGLR